MYNLFGAIIGHNSGVRRFNFTLTDLDNTQSGYGKTLTEAPVSTKVASISTSLTSIVIYRGCALSGTGARSLSTNVIIGPRDIVIKAETNFSVATFLEIITL